MNAAFDEDYFQWLYGQVGSTASRSPRRSFWSLARKLYSAKFHWTIRNDDNREMDGIQLRFEYIEARGTEDYDLRWATRECSILEMLIALARRASFETSKTPDEWFWLMLDNLGIGGISDAHYENRSEDHIHEAIGRLVTRTYERDGRGGLFPLRSPYGDQRKTELWYQMSYYILENDPVEV